MEINAEVRLDTPVEVTNRDVIIVFGWQSDTEFYYAHLSTDNTIYPHNGIFKVNNADRRAHRVPVERSFARRQPGDRRRQMARRAGACTCPATGEIAVYVDGSKDPLMTAARHDVRLRPGRVRLVRQHRAYA